MMTAGPGTACLSVKFGTPITEVLRLPTGVQAAPPIPVLAGQSEELIAGHSGDGTLLERETPTFHLLREGDYLSGLASFPIDDTLETISRKAYHELFQLLGTTYHAYRIWHYVPNINKIHDGLENYHRFNIGRWRAFDERYGTEASQQMPAASAVGNPGDTLVMIFTAGTAPAHFFENPEQTPAYQYPQRYGPKSPSFARAALNASRSRGWISGTASIKGHRTVHVGNLDGQLETTINNLKLMAHEMGWPSWEAFAQEPRFFLKTYLRNADDLTRVSSGLANQLGATERNSLILHTDICRPDLDIEIEASFLRD